MAPLLKTQNSQTGQITPIKIAEPPKKRGKSPATALQF
jgi:hypothetical protein